ncbi:MAG TPA: hypothetical protein VK694_01500 [Verrucomicrobiae bacterium]|nr:hypothetical protein [Verrucomicrobiae bacterium]
MAFEHIRDQIGQIKQVDELRGVIDAESNQLFEAAVRAADLRGAAEEAENSKTRETAGEVAQAMVSRGLEPNFEFHTTRRRRIGIGTVAVLAARGWSVARSPNYREVPYYDTVQTFVSYHHAVLLEDGDLVLGTTSEGMRARGSVFEIDASPLPLYLGNDRYGRKGDFCPSSHYGIVYPPSSQYGDVCPSRDAINESLARMVVRYDLAE